MFGLCCNKGDWSTGCLPASAELFGCEEHDMQGDRFLGSSGQFWAWCVRERNI